MLHGRLVGLRAIEKTDLPQLLAWRNQPGFRRYFREYRELNSSNQENWFEKTVLNNANTLMFAIVQLPEQRLLGAGGLCYVNWVDRSADFSIYLGADDLYIDDRFAPDAAEVMLRYAFDELNLHRLWAEIYDFDEPKKKLFARLGFAMEGRHRATHWSEGEWHDSLFYGRLSSDQAG